MLFNESIVEQSSINQIPDIRRFFAFHTCKRRISYLPETHPSKENRDDRNARKKPLTLREEFLADNPGIDAENADVMQQLMPKRFGWRRIMLAKLFCRRKEEGECYPCSGEAAQSVLTATMVIESARSGKMRIHYR